MFVRELAVRYRRRWIESTIPLDQRVHSPSDAAAILIPILGLEVVEVCGMLCLSTRGHLLAYHELSRGTLDTTVVHPRDVCRTALLTHAAAIVVAHNHPSGDISPSPNDLALTQRLRAATDVIGIDLLDHLIVGVDGRYYSCREASTVSPP